MIFRHKIVTRNTLTKTIYSKELILALDDTGEGDKILAILYYGVSFICIDHV